MRPRTKGAVTAIGLAASAGAIAISSLTLTSPPPPAVGNISGLNRVVLADTPHYIRQPSWLYIDPASDRQLRETCGYWPHTHWLIPGVLVTSGDTAVMFCKNGKAYPS
jgi:hypothetical protein